MTPRRYDDAYFDEQLEHLVQLICEKNLECDASAVRGAFAYAREMHGIQKRDSGEPYVVHPLRVAEILAELQMDQPTIIAALLHDCIEDTSAGYEQIAERFTPEVAQLVDGVTKLESIEFRSKDEARNESLRKMIIAMARDLRVVIIKLADRLHNMRTLRYRDERKRIATAQETLEVYAPLAHRLGISAIKWELEDLSLRFMDPEVYYDLVDKVAMKRSERQQAIDRIIGQLREKLDELGIQAEIDGRSKHFYSIYRKMKEKNLTFDQVYDLIAVRAIVNEIRECYSVLGTVHTQWRPIPGRFKDYISMPKPNLYQSLHTTMIAEDGMPFEVQIRTHAMHRIAEYGVAAHWRYKEGGARDHMDSKLAWLRQISDVQSDVNDAGEFVNMLKVDLFSDEVFVFTPKGDVIDLPLESTPLDFAYRIHSQVGDRCVGAKVNNRIVTLDTKLSTGDIVEILTSSSSKGPSMDWLKIVKTTQARSKIRAALKQNLRDQNVLMGRDMLEREARRQNVELNKLVKGDSLHNVLKRLSIKTLDDLYASVGFGGLSSASVVTRLHDEYQKLHNIPEPVQEPELPTDHTVPRITMGDLDIAVKGENNMLVRFAQCCTPVPGDDIVGYTTRGRGVSVHRADCINIIQTQKDPVERARLIEVSWTRAQREAYNAEIQVIGYDKMGLLAGVTNLIAKQEVPLVAITARTAKNNTTAIQLTVEIKDTKQLDTLISRLQADGDIIEVYRG